MISLNGMLHKNSWDWYALLSNIGYFGSKMRKKVMEFYLFSGKTLKKRVLEKYSKTRKSYESLTYFYKPLIHMMHYVQH